MSRFRYLAPLLAAMVAYLLLSGYERTSPAAAQSPTDGDARFGLVLVPPREPWLGLAYAAGARTIRYQVNWWDIEPSPGRYDWREADAAIRAYRQAGFEVSLILHAPPPWARLVGYDWVPNNLERPWNAPTNFWGRFVFAVAQRYRGQVASYEIFNEPDLPIYWDGSPAQYAQLLAVAARAIRAADSWHWYSNPTDIETRTAWVRDLLARYDMGDKPIWVNETNLPLWGAGGHPVMPMRGYGTPSTYIECFEWFVAPTDVNGENPDPTKAPHVINNSWGCPEMEGCNPSNFPLMEAVVDNVKASGIVVVVSAGNSGSSCSSVSSPAAIFPGSFTVGATASNDTIAGFSSRGPVAVDSSFRRKPDISAPGVGVYSCIRNGQYATWSGTSMAGPHVVGTVALMISANPELAGEVDVIEDIIEQTALPRTTDQNCGDIPGSEVPNNTYGYGRINALAAVQEAMLYTAVKEENAFSTDELRVLPNPFSEELELRLPEVKGTAVFELYNLQGQSVLKASLPATGERKMRLSVAHLPKGIYFYVLKTNDSRTYTGKLIK